MLIADSPNVFQKQLMGIELLMLSYQRFRSFFLRDALHYKSTLAKIYGLSTLIFSWEFK